MKKGAYIDCAVCMYDAPHWYCCRLKCGDFECCRNCRAESKQGDECPNVAIFEERDENGID